ncbi:hypothetical protein MLD38_015145 [Melastoma candidum]|uniref:Uncharacterized protein n=1 Tax=Melastoma candidum TaxID=119954 RepID=A0ACB9RIV3_9MYRT|nr:hypothetical protein MLD38_015145 [Melastoma candidum]
MSNHRCSMRVLQLRRRWPCVTTSSRARRRPSSLRVTVTLRPSISAGFKLKVVTADLKDIDYKSGNVCGILV